jgi:hypothetical protein
MTNIERLQNELHTNREYKIALLNTKLYMENNDLDTTEIEAEIAEVTAEIKAKRAELRAMLAA